MCRLLEDLIKKWWEVKLLAIDPICKMEVDEEKAKYISIHNGKKYYFCAPGCKKTFDKNPDKYANVE